MWQEFIEGVETSINEQINLEEMVREQIEVTLNDFFTQDDDYLTKLRFGNCFFVGADFFGIIGVFALGYLNYIIDDTVEVAAFYAT